jgi:hypothetical protein
LWYDLKRSNELERTMRVFFWTSSYGYEAVVGVVVAADEIAARDLAHDELAELGAAGAPIRVTEVPLKKGTSVRTCVRMP